MCVRSTVNVFMFMMQHSKCISQCILLWNSKNHLTKLQTTATMSSKTQLQRDSMESTSWETNVYHCMVVVDLLMCVEQEENNLQPACQYKSVRKQVHVKSPLFTNLWTIQALWHFVCAQIGGIPPMLNSFFVIHSSHAHL